MFTQSLGKLREVATMMLIEDNRWFRFTYFQCFSWTKLKITTSKNAQSIKKRQISTKNVKEQSEQIDVGDKKRILPTLFSTFNIFQKTLKNKMYSQFEFEIFLNFVMDENLKS